MAKKTAEQKALDKAHKAELRAIAAQLMVSAIMGAGSSELSPLAIRLALVAAARQFSKDQADELATELEGVAEMLREGAWLGDSRGAD